MKSKVVSASPVIDQATTIQRTWGNLAQGVNYVFLIVFENGDQGEYSSKSQGVQNKFIVGVETEYTKTPNANPQHADKIEPVSKGNFSKGGSGQSLKGYALRYAVDAWIAGKIEKDKIYATADYFLKYMEDKPAPVAQTVTTPIVQAEVNQVEFIPEVKPELDDLPF